MELWTSSITIACISVWFAVPSAPQLRRVRRGYLQPDISSQQSFKEAVVNERVSADVLHKPSHDDLVVNLTCSSDLSGNAIRMGLGSVSLNISRLPIVSPFGQRSDWSTPFASSFAMLDNRVLELRLNLNNSPQSLLQRLSKPGSVGTSSVYEPTPLHTERIPSQCQLSRCQPRIYLRC